jgi:serine/threonine protein kinase
VDPMSPGRPRSDSLFGGDSPADPSLEKPLGAVRALAGARFEVLGPLGRDPEGEFAFLGREVSQQRLVVLKQGAGHSLQVITQLDSSVPPPAGSCPVCQAPFVNWEPSCPECGANVAGSAASASGMSPERTLAAVREAAQGYELLGAMPRAVGGAPVYFARDLSGGHLVALRLEQESGPGHQPGYTITATRMMRPKLLYGRVSGEASGDPGMSPGGPGMWTPVPSPPVAMRAAQSPAPGGSWDQSLAGEKVCPQCNHGYGPELRFCPRDGAVLRARATSDNLIGRVIADRYNIVGKLGQGGMGTVYLAEHVRMGRRCAVKVMNSILMNDPDSLDRFSREAKNASLLNHPHIAAVYDFGETADGIVYLAMEFVEGESLAAVLHRNRGLSEQQALDLGSQVADALSAAHELGIVHRDLKPDNIMLCSSKSGKLRVKVVDFGIAKATRGSSQTVTRTGYVVGTPAYMSPEQILGDPLDGRSDLYSLGCILYEMLTGERAFTGPSGEVSIRRRLSEPPPRPRSVKQALSKALDHIVTKSMARAPEHRFQSASELRDALLAVLLDRPKRAGWQRWLPWAHQQDSGEVAEEVLVSRPGEVLSSSPLISPAPFPAASMLEGSPLPVAPDWSDSAHPATRLRHRSARSEGSSAGRWVGGLVGAALLGVATLYVMTSGEPAGYRSRVADLVRSITSSIPSMISSNPGSLPDTSQVELPEEESTSPQVDPALPGEQPGASASAIIRFDKPLPAGARITVDSIEVKPTNEGLFTLEPGSHVIAVRAPGYRKATRTVTAPAGDTTDLGIELAALPPKPVPAADTAMGAIVLEGSLPADAVIRVDGRVAPRGSKVLTVTPGLHWVSVSIPGYASDSSQVEVEHGSWSDWSVPALTRLTEPSQGYAPESVPQPPTESADSLPSAPDIVPDFR